nr:hypothetical protein [Tanacetum cinerariifolium]GEY53382.1 hypothetical protein [Tanacetum cinerariifolium]
MKICTTLQKKVLDLVDELKRTKTSQQTKINGLERRVKKLEKKYRSRTNKLKRLYNVGLTARVISSSDDEALDKEDASKQGRIDEIDADKGIALEEIVEVVTTTKMFIDTVVDVAQVTTVIVDILVSAAETIVTIAPTIIGKFTKTNVKPRVLKNKSFVKIQESFDKAMKRINTFVDFRTELVEESIKKDEAETAQESSSKRKGDKLEQERSKKQKVENDKKSKELKQCLEIISDDRDEVTIDATPLSSKSPIIVDYKIHKEGKKNYF